MSNKTLQAGLRLWRLRLRLNDFLEEIKDSEDPSFMNAQVDFLQERFDELDKLCTDAEPADKKENPMKVFDSYQVSGGQRFSELGFPEPDGDCTAICDDDEAEFWTLYACINDKTVHAFGDFPTREEAEQLYFRITGQRFAGASATAAHLRVMHAGPTLLKALTNFFNIIHDYENSLEKGYVKQSMHEAKAAIEQATGRAA